MDPQSAAIHLGTSSWLFPAWRGVFYPETATQKDYLAYYSRHFDTVEVNTSFYGIPRPSTLVDWVETVPAGFTFCLKIPKAISHEKRLLAAEAETREFLEVMRSLGEAAGPAFLQLPPNFTRRQEGKALADYIGWLAPLLNGVRLAVEVRSDDLMTASFAQFLAQHGLALVLVDRVGAPDLYEAWFELVQQGAAPRFALIRWIGDDRHGPQGDRELSAPRDADLDRWAARLAALARAGVDCFGYMHNPYEGHAPASVRRLQQRVAPLAALPIWAPPAPPGDDESQLPLFD